MTDASIADLPEGSSRTSAEAASHFLPVLWVAAFVCALYPVNAFQLEFFGAAVILALAFAFLMFCRGLDHRGAVAVDVRRSPLLAVAGAFWLLTALSLFWSEVKPASLMGLCFFSVLPLGLFGGVAGGGRRMFIPIAWMLALVFAVLAIWAIVQFFFLNAYFLGQARHPLADPSSLGALFSLAFFCALGGIVGGESGRTRTAAVILASLLLCGMMATVARGPLLALVPGLVVFALVLWRQARRRWAGLLLVVLAGGAFYGLMHATSATKKFDLATRFEGTLAEAASDYQGTNNRRTIWRSAAEMVKERPLLGSGIGTFYLRYPQFRAETDTDGAYLAHNDPLQFWVELGVLGPVLFYAFVLLAALRTRKALSRLAPSGGGIVERRRVVVGSIFAAMTALVAHAHVAFNFYNLSILMLAGFLLAVWYVATARAIDGDPPPRMPREASSMHKFLILLPFVMTGWLFASVIAGEHYANRARDALFAERMFDFAEDVNRADHASLGLNFRTYLLAINVPMSILAVDRETKKPYDASHQAQLYAQVDEYAKRITAINPYEPSPYFYLGQVQQFVDPQTVPADAEKPEVYYARALALDPAYLQARLALDDVYAKEGRPAAERIALLEKGIRFTYTTPVAAEFYQRLAKLYLETRQYEKTKDVMQRMQGFRAIDQFSRLRQASSIPQALIGGDALMKRP